ncbi:hypothetical protein BGX20_004698 [Mortierella sp. AD010]|nr:hypothetical protein BGX20_004698 [Mortierella sp. AD010]
MLSNEQFAVVANSGVVLDSTSKQQRGTPKTRVNLPFKEKREAILAWDILQPLEFPITTFTDIYGIQRTTLYGFIGKKDELRKVPQDRLIKCRTRCPQKGENNVCTVYEMVCRTIASLLSIQHCEFDNDSYDLYKRDFLKREI